MESKKCTKCLCEKNIENFSNQKRSKDKHSPWCKQCHIEYSATKNKEFYEKNKHKMKKWCECGKYIFKKNYKIHLLSKIHFKRMNNEVFYEPRNKIIYLEGNIGSGKSTLINLLTKYDFIKTHHEPLYKWKDLNGINLFSLSSEDPMKYSFLFQLYITLTMHQRQLFDYNENKINVMERSLLTAKEIFIKASLQNNLIEKPFCSFFDEWIEFINKTVEIKPHYIIYLRTNPNNLLERIKKRGRLEEKNITLKFLQQLHQLHEEYIIKMSKNCKILIIDCNTNLNEETLEKILHFIKEVK